MADAVSVLRQEIGKLEQELDKRRRALTMLTGAGAPTKSSATAAKKSPPKPQAAQRPATAPAAAPSLATRIMTHMTANKGKSFTTAEVAQALAKIDKSVKRDNVQRRLGELVQGKKLKRDNGRYGVV
jgi:hypothetical protein